MEVHISEHDQSQINFMDFSTLNDHDWDLDYLNACVYYHQLKDSVRLSENNFAVELLDTNITNIFNDIAREINSIVDIRESPIKFLGQDVIQLVDNNFVTNPYTNNNGEVRYLADAASPEFKGFLSGAYGEAIVQYLFNQFKSNGSYSIAKLERKRIKTPDFIIFENSSNTPHSFWEAKGTVSHLPSADKLKEEKDNPQKQIQSILTFLQAEGFQFNNNGVFSKVHVPVSQNNRLRTRIVDPEIAYAFNLPNVLLEDYILLGTYKDYPVDKLKENYLAFKKQDKYQQSQLDKEQKNLYDKYSFLIKDKSTNNKKDYEKYLEEIKSSVEYKDILKEQDQYIESLLPIIGEPTVGKFYNKVNKMEEDLIIQIAQSLRENKD